ncbi:MAG: DNA polymerase III subunit gamma/tau [Bacillota bacterium]|nr:DNA polymerase III subunit gamma/tau [Bacillota bacterium]
MYTALYRAYRPEVFDEVLGQEHIVKILKNQIATDSTNHAYLFCGTRGTGKTTTARLLAKGLNCLDDGERPCGRCANCRAISEGNFMDVIEIDAASNNGVDNIRELRESVNYPPAVGRKKVYIIDEVHMLSTGAFNALLKTLEEPPEDVVFILATTEVHKLPATILSRCMRLDFKRVPETILIKGLAAICEKIGINVTEDALRIISANADGSVRDALSILDQCISGGDRTVGEKDVLEFLGASGDEVFIELTDRIRKRRTSEAIEYLADILSDGKDVKQFMRDWINHYRNLLLTKYVRDPSTVLNMSSENIERVRRQSAVLELEDINRGILELSKASNEARWSTQPRILLELSIVKLCMGAGEIKRATEFRKVDEPVELAGPAEPAVPVKTAETAEPVRSAQPAEPEEPLAKPQPEPVPEPVPETSDVDVSELWDEVFQDSASQSGIMSLIRQGGTLVSIDDEEFTVVVSNVITREHAEKNRKLIEELMQKYTGKHRRMNLSLKSMAKEQLSAEDIASNAGEVLGIKVEIK